ncbi:MAG: beta strand repeat-containing protein [Blastocatellia bacterium]
MAGREYIFNLYRLASRRAVVIALVAVFLAAAGFINWRHQAAGREVSTETAVNTVSLVSLAGRTFEQSEGAQGSVVGEFEGYFDSKTQTFTVDAKRGRTGKDSRLYSRSDPSGDVVGFGRRVIRSAYVNNADNPPTVTGEFELTNTSAATLYNTRVVFTSFKLTNAGGADAGNMPGASGFAYFNDGQVAYNGKLSVSRNYGDLAAGAAAARVWTFAVTNTPPSFFFTYKVIADLGVAAESVAPAAVQVNAGTGTSVTINGRGFTGTPTVELLPATGAAIAMTGVTATATSITATVPAGTAAAIYSVRVTNPGGTAGGQGSSTIRGRLTVTGVPATTLTGTIPGGAFPSAGAYLVSGNSTIGASTPIPAGTVIYVAGGATLSIAGGGNVNADGGTPGVSANAAQIVFTAQRSPGASVPTNGAWGGIDATGASTATMTMRNVVVEYGGGSGFAGVNISGSGRTIRFTDGILRNSAGSGLRAAGGNDNVVGFSRNRVDSNGTSATDAALLVSGNASLGLFDLPATGATIATSVGDASYYYSSANDFNGNQLNAVRIGVTADAASNDFSKSGVLVGQESTPIQIAGDCSNPAIVGAAAPAAPAELTIAAGANIQLAADLNLQAGDYATNRVGCIAANGYAGIYLGPQPGAPVANQMITFDKIAGGGNFGAIFFARNAMANCILNYVSVQNGGANSACSLGSASIISDGVNVKVTNSQVSNSATGGVLAISGAKIDTRGTTTSNTTPIIDTVVGGQLGDGNPGLKVNIITPAAAAVDPQGRGVYFVDVASSGNFIRFFNTSRNAVTLGGMKIAPGTIRTVVGGGLDGADNIPGRAADPGTVTGLGLGSNGDILYYADSISAAVRAWNASASAKTIGGASINPGSVGTLAGTGLGTTINAIAVHPTTGDVYVGDATAGVNKIFKILAAGGAPTAFAGNGAASQRNEPLTNGVAATSVPLIQPRGLAFDPAGNLYIADTGHGRVARVNSGGNIFSVYQLDVPPPPGSWNNPFISGLAVYSGKLYAALGNQQTIIEITNPSGASPAGAVIAGMVDTACDYSSSTCGDGGTLDQAGFNLLGSTATPPLAGLAADSKGVFVMDQGTAFKGRIRYMNLSASATEVAGVAIPANNINTVGGTGLASPFEGSLASSADLFAPIGAAMDANGNLWVTNSTVSRLQFINCGTSPVTIFNGTQAQQTVAPGTAVTVNKDVGAGPTDGAPVNSAAFDTPQGIVATAQGIFIADSRRGPTITTMARRTGLIRFINTSASPVTFYSTGGTGIPTTVPPGNIATIAGGGVGNIGDGPNPFTDRFLGPTDIAIHPTTGDLYIADAGQQTGTSASSPAASRVRRINRSTGAVSTILTGGVNDAFTGVSFDSAGRLLVANAGRKTSTTVLGNSAILREKASGQCATTPAGCFDTILSGGTGSLLKNPRDVAEGKDGALYVTNAGPSESGKSDNKILKIVISGTTGTATVFAGGTIGYSGDGGSAANAQLNLEATDFQTSTSGTRFDVRVNISISVAPNGDIIFSDSKNNAIRRIR